MDFENGFVDWLLSDEFGFDVVPDNLQPIKVAI